MGVENNNNALCYCSGICCNKRQATICAGSLGGAMIGIKWLPNARYCLARPILISPVWAHCDYTKQLIDGTLIAQGVLLHYSLAC